MKNIYRDLCLNHYGCNPEYVDNKVYCDFVLSLNDKFRKKHRIDIDRKLNVNEEKDFQIYLKLLTTK